MKALNRYTLAYVVGVLIPVSALIGIQLTHSWRAHAAARDSMSSLRVVHGTLDAFYCNEANWHGMVLGQTRVAVLQALRGLQTA